MRTANLGFFRDDKDVNSRWGWVIAFDAYDFADPGPLEEMLRGDKELPSELRPILADIVSGKRKPNRKAAAKLKIPAAERMKAAGSLSAVLGLIDMLKHEEIYDAAYGFEAFVQRPATEIAADAQGKDQIDLVRHLEAKADSAINSAMKHFDVSRETIENLLRDLRKKLRDYPNV